MDNALRTRQRMLALALPLTAALYISAEGRRFEPVELAEPAKETAWTTQMRFRSRWCRFTLEACSTSL
jgi:hypothetical protein